jgi:membrane protease YdiL (CAAX protease family)
MQAPTPKITPEILQQNPLLAVYLILVFGVMSMVAIGSFACWGLVFYRRSQSKSLLPLIEPWEPRRWAFVDLLVLGATFVASQVIFAGLASKWMQVEPSGKLSLEIAAAGGLGSIFAVVFGSVWICLRYQTTASHVGFGWLGRKMIVIGLIGGLLGLPLMYLVMGVVSALSNIKYEHPLINSASESGLLQTYLFGIFAAAIAAPIAEEFFFRVILQGWLQSIPFKTFMANFIGSISSDSANAAIGQVAEITVPVQSDMTQNTGLTVEEIYSSPSISGGRHSLTAETNPARVIPPIWPSIITGLLFGLAHIEYGVSFIPLSLLGIFLGLIYRQTHSIWPCIIIHMMLNSFSMMMLGLLILMKRAGITVE